MYISAVDFYGSNRIIEKMYDLKENSIYLLRRLDTETINIFSSSLSHGHYL
jgi:hypothetical protein